MLRRMHANHIAAMLRDQGPVLAHMFLSQDSVRSRSGEVRQPKGLVAERVRSFTGAANYLVSAQGISTSAVGHKPKFKLTDYPFPRHYPFPRNFAPKPYLA